MSAPVILLSLAAAYQYTRGRSTGAGAAAVVLYWVLLVMFWISAGPLYILGALLQSAAWWISRPRSRTQRSAAANAS